MRMADNSRPNIVTEIQLEYDRIDRQWMTLHYRTVLGIVGIGLFFELLLTLIFYRMMLPQINISFARYASLYIVKPFLMNTGFLLLSVIAMRVESMSTQTRIYLLSLSLIGVCFVLYSAHYIFYISILFLAPILLTAFYSDYRITSVVTALSLLAKLGSDFFIFWDADRIPPFESGLSIMSIVVSSLMILFFYAISMIIISFQKKKNDSVLQIERERHEMQQQLRTDPLTGINNRLALRNMFQAIENAVSDTYFFAMIDLDNFKALNDNFGHAKGDVCLEELGGILKRHGSEDIMPFRFGGDEFCLLFRNKNREEVTWICKVIREEFKLKNCAESMAALTISIGVAEYERGMYVEDLMNNADEALYRAKETKDAISF